ncbi:C-opsin [Ephemera danica]|nr:C-opsin [Ephemera danica]
MCTVSCSVNWEHRTQNATSYIVFLFVLGLVVPVTVICFSYLNIVWTMKKNAISMGRVSRAETRVAVMVAVMVVAFLVAWIPYSVFALTVAFGDPSVFTPALAVLPALMAKSSICYNPVIYVGLNTQFRVAWRKLLGVAGPVSSTSQEFGGQHTALSLPVSHDAVTTTDGKPPASWRAIFPPTGPTRDQQQQLEAALEKVHLKVSQLNGGRMELSTVRDQNDVVPDTKRQEDAV